MIQTRVAGLAARQRKAGIDCVALIPGPNLRYLSGLDLFVSERPIVAFFPLGRRPAVVLPALERGRAEAMVGNAVDFYPYTDEEGAASAFARLADELELGGKRVCVEFQHMRVTELRAIESTAPGVDILSLEHVLPGLRTVKDDAEIAAMRRAIGVTEDVLRELIAEPVIGRTEREIAGELAVKMMRAGADRIAFIIVVAGPNGADPHRGPSDRPVQAGELLTIDCGMVLDGYLSDITRTFALEEVSDELRSIYEVVRRANEAGRSAVCPGVAAQDVDRAARKVIADAGYGRYFVHRTGHGLGLEGHEPPYIVKGNELVLEPGMTFTVEPGIYVPGLGGVRIEDDVAVTVDGVECLTSFPRELLTVS